MSHSSPLVGIDNRGNHVPLVASISHPEKDVILVKWKEGFNAAIFTLGPDTIIAIGDGAETYTFKVAMVEGEQLVSVERDEDAREMRVVTHVG